MPSPASTADEIAENIKALIERVADAKFTQEMARRGQDSPRLAERADEAWRDDAPLRRDAAKRLSRATDDAAKWSDQTWRKSRASGLKDLWKRRTLALGAAGAAVPAGTRARRHGRGAPRPQPAGGAPLGRLLPRAAARGRSRRDRRHAATPKRGEEMRRELGAPRPTTSPRRRRRPSGCRSSSGETPRTVSTARLPGATPGRCDGQRARKRPPKRVPRRGEAADQAAADTAEAINDSYDAVDRESRL